MGQKSHSVKRLKLGFFQEMYFKFVKLQATYMTDVRAQRYFICHNSPFNFWKTKTIPNLIKTSL